MLKKFMVVSLIAGLIMQGVSLPAGAIVNLPAPGLMIGPSEVTQPFVMRGMRIHADDPLLFDFIFDSGDTPINRDSPEFRASAKRLVNYFLASLTLPEKDVWVNLSPHEKDRIIPSELAQTALGRDMLAQDYLLKQLSSTLIYPEKDLGRAFWERVYQQVSQRTDVSISAEVFNKVWITAGKAKVVVKGGQVIIVGARLKAMMDVDYRATRENQVVSSDQNPAILEAMREVVLPEIEREVNEGKNFSHLRQIFYSMILATWYKRSLRESLLNDYYKDRKLLGGIAIADETVAETIYARYLDAYRKGVFDLIREETNGVETIPKRYFSGGITRLNLAETVSDGDEDYAMTVAALPSRTLIAARVRLAPIGADFAMRKVVFNDSEPLLHQLRRYYPQKRLKFGEAHEYARLILNEIFKMPPDKISSALVRKASTDTEDTLRVIRDIIIQDSLKTLNRTEEPTSNALLIKKITHWLYDYEARLDVYRDPYDKDGPKDPDVGPNTYWQMLQNKNILITGGAGGLGTALEKGLLYSGAKILSFQRAGRREREAKAFGRVVNEREVAYFIQHGRLSQGEFIENLMVRNKPDVVVHLGGASLQTMKHPAYTFDSNFNYTRLLLNAAIKAKVKGFVYVSTVLVDDPVKTPYSESKFFTEQLVREMCGKARIPYVIFNAQNIAGSYYVGGLLTGDHKSRIIPNLTREAVVGSGVLKMRGNPNTEIAFVSFRDMVDLLLRSIGNLVEGGKGGTYAVTPRSIHSVRDVFLAVKKIVPETRIVEETVEQAPIIRPRKDWRPVFAEFHWHAQDDLLDVVKQAVEVWKQRGDFPAPEPPPDVPMEQEVVHMTRIFMDLTGRSTGLSQDLRLHILASLFAYSLSPSSGLGKEMFEEREREIFVRYQSKHSTAFHFTESFRADKAFIELIREYAFIIRKEPDPIYKIRKKYAALLLTAADAAQKASSAPGGIDLDGGRLELDIAGERSYNGQADAAHAALTGVVPVILRVSPLGGRELFTPGMN